MAHATHLSAPAQHHNRLVALMALAALAALIACMWKLTPAAHYLSPDMIAHLFRHARHSVWAVPAVIGIYIIACVTFFPLTILVVATAMVFPPAEACAVALAGALSSACLGYSVGRFSGLDLQHLVNGRSEEKIRHYAKDAGVLGVALLRLLPLLPLTVVDVGLGMAGIGFPTYIAATLVGLLPGIVALSLLGHSIGFLWHSHNVHGLIYVALGVAGWFGAALAAHFTLRHYQQKKAQ